MSDVDLRVMLPCDATIKGLDFQRRLLVLLKNSSMVERLSPLALYFKETVEFIHSGIPVDVTYAKPDDRRFLEGQRFAQFVRDSFRSWSRSSQRCVRLVQLLCKCTGFAQPEGYSRGSSFKSIHLAVMFQLSIVEKPSISDASTGAQLIYFLRWFVGFPFRDRMHSHDRSCLPYRPACKRR